MRRTTLSAVLMGALLACARTNGAARDGAEATPDTQPGDARRDVSITLERTPCYGTCPVYRLSITGNGAVSFEGRQHVQRPGVATGHISEEQVQALVSAFEEADFFALADRYEYGEPTCSRYVTDHPSAVTTYTIGGRSKTVRHDYGCRGAPQQLTKLEAQIDSVAGASRWIGAR